MPIDTGRKVVRFVSCTIGGKPGLRAVYSDGTRGPCRAISPDPAVQTLGDFSPLDLVRRIAIGALGASLVIVGLLMISADVTLSQAARRFGAEIGKVAARGAR